MKKYLFIFVILAIQFPFFKELRADNSKVLKNIPVPTKRPKVQDSLSGAQLYVDKYYYFYTKRDSPAPIIKSTGEAATLPGDTLIRFKILPNPVRGEENLISFETVPSHVNEPVIKGKVPYTFLGEEMGGGLGKQENLERYKEVIKVYSEIQKKERLKKEKKMSVEDVLEEFHQSYCKDKGAARTEKALKAKWDGYIKNTMQSERGKQLAQNAKTLDLVARTIMYEAQIQKNIKPNPHPKAASCQWDLIALSIRNRAFSNNVKGYGGKERGDIIGVATDSQYNVWFERKVKRNPNLLACYLDSNYGSEIRQNKFKAIVSQIKPTLLSGDGDKIGSHDISHRFKITNPNISPTPRLNDMTHYFHPGGMGRCNVNERISPNVKSGILRLTDHGYPKFIPIVNGKVLGMKGIKIVKASKSKKVTYLDDPTPSEEWEFNVLHKKGKRTVEESSKDFFGKDVVLVNTKNLDERYKVHHYNCLPKGILPQCFEGKRMSSKKLSSLGVKVPYTWFNKGLRGEMVSSLERLGFKNAARGFKVPASFPNASPAGVPIGIRCTSDGMRDSSRPGKEYPEFGGGCDPNIVMASGVDQRIPTIPTPTPRPPLESDPEESDK